MRILSVIVIVFAAMFCWHAGFCQSQSNNPAGEAINRYHISPKAGELFRAGAVPVNLSGGQIQYSIPIHTIKSGSIDWPISLNYAYNGLLLEARPSEVGLGWNLSGGGAIVRQVRGLPDEHPHGYWGSGSRRNLVDSFTSPGDLSLPIVQDFVSNLYDAEPDKFVLNAGGLNVSFFISNVSGQTIIVTPTQENTEIIFSWDQINVKDSQGITYIFYNKETSTFSSSHWQLMDQMPSYTTTWLLSEIRLQNGRSIAFHYQPQLFTSISHSESYNRTANSSGTDVTIDCGSIGGQANTNYYSSETLRELSHSKSYNIADIEANYLESILWDEGSIVFERNMSGSNGYLPMISRATIKNFGNQTIDSFDFIYDHQSRPLLAQLIKNGLEKYGFENYPVNIGYITEPYTGGLFNNGQNPYAQDFWGFGNGAPNTTSIPEKGANRFPNFYFSIQGALHRISYPTGGSTSLSYEPNQIKVSSEEFLLTEPVIPNSRYEISMSQTPLNEWMDTSYTFTFIKPTFAKISHGAYIKGSGTQLNISFLADCVSCGQSGQQTYYEYAPLQRLINPSVTPTFYPSFGVALTGDNIQENCGIYFTGCEVQSITSWIIIEPGTYTLSVQSYNTLAASYNFIIDYFENVPEGTNPPFVNMDAAGIRVASSKNCPGISNSDCVEKYYKYVGEDGISSGIYQSKIDYSYNYFIYDAHDCRDYSIPGSWLPLLVTYDYPAVSYNFRTLNSLEFHAGSPVYYNRVEVWDDPNKSNGVEVNHFHNSTWGLTGSYPYTPLPKNPINGAAYKSEIHRTGFYPMKLTEKELLNSVQAPAVDLSLFTDGLVIGIGKEYRYTPLWDPTYFTSILLTEGYLYSKYEVEKPTKLLLLNQQERSYNPELNKQSTYTYNTKLQLESSETIDSKGKINRTVYYYPHNVSDPGNTELVALNNISKPVKTEEFIDGSLVKSSQVYYQKWFTSPLIVEPQRYESTMGGVTYIETQANAYSDLGNLLEVTARDGVKSSFLWAYNEQFPVAKIVNAATGSYAYEGFEESSNSGGWTYSINASLIEFKTGSKSHQLNGASVSRTGLDSSQEYILSYWAKGGDPVISGGVQSSNDGLSPDPDGWRYYEKRLTTITNVSLSYGGPGISYIDEIRVYPKGASMTTYTYRPLVGITSVNDPNNLISYYEYDSSNRLKLIRDNKGNIVQSFTYNYRK